MTYQLILTTNRLTRCCVTDVRLPALGLDSVAPIIQHSSEASPLQGVRIVLASPIAHWGVQENIWTLRTQPAVHGEAALSHVRRDLPDSKCALATGVQGASPLPPSLRVAVSAAHTEADLEQGASAIRRAAAAVLPKKAGRD